MAEIAVSSCMYSDLDWLADFDIPGMSEVSYIPETNSKFQLFKFICRQRTLLRLPPKGIESLIILSSCSHLSILCSDCRLPSGCHDNSWWHAAWEPLFQYSTWYPWINACMHTGQKPEMEKSFCRARAAQFSVINANLLLITTHHVSRHAI